MSTEPIGTVLSRTVQRTLGRMTNVGVRIDERVVRSEALLGCVLLVLLVGILSIQVASRQAPWIDAPWTEELSRFVFVWLAFIGTSVALQRGAHISINLVVDHLGPAAQRTISIIVRILILGFAIIMIWYGARLCLSTQMVSTVLEIPMSIPYAAIPFSGSLMAFHGIVGITRLIARGESETAQ